MKENNCQWELPNGKLCGKKTLAYMGFCYIHEPLALIGYTRLKSKKTKGKSKSKQEDWRADIDRDMERSRELRQSTRGIASSRSWKPKDFPTAIDGIWFETIDDFYIYYTGDDYEMAGVDQEYLIDEVLPPAPRSRSQKLLPFSSYSQQGWGSDYHPRDWENYKPAKSKPKTRLEPGSYRKIYAIMHMRYVVVRLKSTGNYHAVWISMDCPDAFHASGVDSLAKMMEYVLEMNSKAKEPVSVTETAYGRYHASRAYDNFDSAESCFHRGGESFYRIEERIKKVKDPNWIPPNLRKLAIKNQYHLIPEAWHERLKAWVKAGCPGWWGSKGTVFDTKKPN